MKIDAARAARAHMARSYLSRTSLSASCGVFGQPMDFLGRMGLLGKAVTDRCRYGAVMQHYPRPVPDMPVNIAHI
jgi:hypothetical protein